MTTTTQRRMTMMAARVFFDLKAFNNVFCYWEHEDKEEEDKEEEGLLSRQRSRLFK